MSIHNNDDRFSSDWDDYGAIPLDPATIQIEMDHSDIPKKEKKETFNLRLRLTIIITSVIFIIFFIYIYKVAFSSYLIEIPFFLEISLFLPGFLLIICILALVIPPRKRSPKKRFYKNSFKIGKHVVTEHNGPYSFSAVTEQILNDDFRVSIDSFQRDVKQEFNINNFLTLKLIGNKTEIYIKDLYFQQCKFLLLNIPKNQINDLDHIESIDEASELLDRSLEYGSSTEIHISPEEEFWGHCSNLQAWYEHDYDTRLLHSNLAFPLLKKLTEAGDPLAKKVFKEEIALRLESGYEPVIEYLIEENYLHFLNDEELTSLLDNPLFSSILVKKIIQAHIRYDPVDNYFSSFQNDKIESIKYTLYNLPVLSQALRISPKLISLLLRKYHSNTINNVFYISTIKEFERIVSQERPLTDKTQIILIDDQIRKSTFKKKT